MCNQDGSCGEGDDGITVNGLATGEVAGGGGSLPVTVKFFGFARDNQMPIREIKIDWDGDGTTRNLVNPGPGLYRNHRGTDAGGKSLCDGTGFGRIEGKTCDSTAPFIYNFVYACPTGVRLQSVRDAAGLHVCGQNPSRPGLAANQDSNCWNDARQTCQYIPRVQVKDNWGFCNGVCAGGEDGRMTCYEGVGPSDRECSRPALSSNPWTPFSGKVLVRPR